LLESDDMDKAWSDEARAAALAARRGHGGGGGHHPRWDKELTPRDKAIASQALQLQTRLGVKDLQRQAKKLKLPKEVVESSDKHLLATSISEYMVDRFGHHGFNKGEDDIVDLVKGLDDDTDHVRIAKIDESLGLVMGWAIVCKVEGEDYYDLNIDRDTGERVPEHIPEDAMLKASAEFMENSRVGNEMHKGPDSGTYVFAFPLTTDIAEKMGIVSKYTGLMVAYKPTPEVFEKFKDGTYSGFSIEGRRLRSEMISVTT
jgi:hypothetical protein